MAGTIAAAAAAAPAQAAFTCVILAPEVKLHQ
jgi:hypothetical protein